MISSKVKIEPTGRLWRRAALRLMAHDGSDASARRAETLGKLYHTRRRADGAVFWHARRGRRCIAAAMVVPNPGRFGMLLYSPPGAPGVDASALSDLLGLVSERACREGLAFVQSLVLPDACAEVAVLASAGLIELARLLYMRLNLLGAETAGDPWPDGQGPERAPGAGPWTWRGYDQFDDAELCRAIAATYRGSLDCPTLAGTRNMADVVAGHKANGTFRPSSWWLVQRGGSSAGCILVNGSSSPRVAEVVYMGVLPAFRGCGLGRAMLVRAAAEARRKGNHAVTLAVDSQNVHALGLYETSGFKQIFSRLAYMTPPKGRPKGAIVEEM